MARIVRRTDARSLGKIKAKSYLTPIKTKRQVQTAQIKQVPSIGKTKAYITPIKTKRQGQTAQIQVCRDQ